MLAHTILDASSVELWLVICEATTTGASQEHCRQLGGRNHGLLALLNSLKHPRGNRSEARFFGVFFGISCCFFNFHPCGHEKCAGYLRL